MKRIFAAMSTIILLSAGAAMAAGNPAISNQTTTSMGAPPGSPGYRAARSEAVPGLPAQARNAQERNERLGNNPTIAPTNPVTKNAQLTR